jgi:mannose-1-phosphate guanylyltransferase/phosphomannomutase
MTFVSTLDIKVVILAGGTGFFLRPLSLERPKTLCTVCNVSLLARLLAQLQVAGIKKAVVALPMVAEETQSLALAAAPSGFQLDITLPSGSLTFGGTVPAARKSLDSEVGSVMIIYGDSLLSVDFGKLITFHHRVCEKGGWATILYHRPVDLRVADNHGRTYHGVMSVNADGRVTKFVEKPKVEEIKDGFELANAAVLVCERALLEDTHFRGAMDFSFDILQPAINERLAPVYGCSIGDGFRYDTGTIGRFYDANVKVLRRELRAYLPGREQRFGFWVGENTNTDPATVTPPVLLGNNVCIGQNVELGPDVVIGDGCRIGDGTVIRRAVIMEKCQIGPQTSIDRCILGPHCRVAGRVKVPCYTVLGAYGVVAAEGWPIWTAEEAQ